LSDIALPEPLNASHIIPWKVDVARRADPRNGIASNALCDRAFDCGLITFDESFRLVLSRRVPSDNPPPLRQALLRMEGQKLNLPERFAPDPAAMQYHCDHIFDCIAPARVRWCFSESTFCGRCTPPMVVCLFRRRRTNQNGY